MNQKSLFEMLGAPLKNYRWSWGAVRSDGTVFLRVWKDRIREHNGSRYVQITHRKPHDSDTRKNPGHHERLEHVSRIRSGAPCYLVMCEAEDTKAHPRRVARFNQHEVFPGGRIIALDGEHWAELRPGVPVRTVARASVRRRA